jgi:ribosomal protein S30
MPPHGSLTKAGKVRNQTPKIASGASKWKSTGPRRGNRADYLKMLASANDFNRGRGRGRRGRRRRRR